MAPNQVTENNANALAVRKPNRSEVTDEVTPLEALWVVDVKAKVDDKVVVVKKFFSFWGVPFASFEDYVAFCREWERVNPALSLEAWEQYVSGIRLPRNLTWVVDVGTLAGNLAAAPVVAGPTPTNFTWVRKAATGFFQGRKI